MSDLNKYDIVYFLVAEFYSKKEIINFSANKTRELLEAIEQAKELLQEYSITKNKKNKFNYKNFELYYYLNKENFLFICIMKSYSSPNNKIDSGVFEFFESVESQGIIKYTDKNGELNNVGKQNLMYLIDKYFSNDSIKSLGDTSVSSNGSKILQVTSDVNDIKLDMKNGIKKIVSNVESVRELENKAERINNTSLLFRKDAELLRRRSYWSNIKTLIIVSVIAAILAGYFLYIIFS
jgi:hypothetical protein